MNESNQKVGTGYGEKQAADKQNGAQTSAGTNINQAKPAVRDITREQWFWDTAVLS